MVRQKFNSMTLSFVRLSFCVRVSFCYAYTPISASQPLECYENQAAWYVDVQSWFTVFFLPRVDAGVPQVQSRPIPCPP